MKRLIVCSLLLSSLATADVMEADNKHNVTVDCKKDPVVDISGNKNTYKLKGECKQLRVSGNDNTVTAETLTAIMVSGNRNTVTAAATDQIAVSGDHNTVSWKKTASKDKKSPGVLDNGDGNKVAQGN